MIYFISGHRNITSEEFDKHYKPMLDKALKEGANFVIGDYHGVDTMAQKYLLNKTTKVVVYHMFTSSRNNAGFSTHGGFEDDESRDAAMTKISHEDIAWVRQGKEKSGTAINLKRRKTQIISQKI